MNQCPPGDLEPNFLRPGIPAPSDSRADRTHSPNQPPLPALTSSRLSPGCAPWRPWRLKLREPISRARGSHPLAFWPACRDPCTVGQGEIQEIQLCRQASISISASASSVWVRMRRAKWGSSLSLSALHEAPARGREGHRAGDAASPLVARGNSLSQPQAEWAGRGPPFPATPGPHRPSLPPRLRPLRAALTCPVS